MVDRDSSAAEARGARVFTDDNGVSWEVTWPNLLAGRIPLTELDDEELSRMQLRNTSGNFSGYQPRVVPRELADAHARELLARNDKLMKEVVLKATKAFTDVLDDPEAEHRDKMKAAEYLHNRILGKTPDKVEVRAELKPWEGVVGEIAVITGGDDDEASSPEVDA